MGWLDGFRTEHATAVATTPFAWARIKLFWNRLRGRTVEGHRLDWK